MCADAEPATDVKTQRRGFTIIEVMLFLAISGFLLIGLMVGVTTTVARQRYNDSVQDLAEFLRSIYSEVINIQNPRQGSGAANVDVCRPVVPFKKSDYFFPQQGNHYELTSEGIDKLVKTYENGGNYYSEPTHVGKSDCLIYGKMLVTGADDTNAIRIYDLIGESYDPKNLTDTGDDLWQLLSDVELGMGLTAQQLTIGAKPRDGQPGWKCLYSYVGGGASMATYSPQWDAEVQVQGIDKSKSKMTILIVRSPLTGTVHTLVYDGVVEIVKAMDAGGLVGNIKDGDNLHTGGGNNEGLCFQDDHSGNLKIDADIINAIPESQGPSVTLKSQLAQFKFTEINFCIGSPDIFAVSDRRRNIRIIEDGRNSTSVELVALDDGDNQCR